MDEPKVSVVCITFNHEHFVGQAIQSFLDQDAPFSIEIVVADDASTDGTAAVVRDFAERHAAVNAVLRPANVGIGRNLVDALGRARGQYVALCEGDDYWTDPEKLARQVAALDSAPDAMLAFHRTEVFYEDSAEDSYTLPPRNWKGDVSLGALLHRNVIATSSVLYRKLDYADVPVDILPLDWYLHLFHASRGRAIFLDRTMSRYRRHSGGVWRGVEESSCEFWQRHGLRQLAMFESILALVGEDPAHRDVVLQHTRGALGRLAACSDAGYSGLSEQAAREFPALVDDFARFSHRHWEQASRREATTAVLNRDLEAKVASLRTELGRRSTRIGRLQDEVSAERARLEKARADLDASRAEVRNLRSRRLAVHLRRVARRVALPRSRGRIVAGGQVADAEQAIERRCNICGSKSGFVPLSDTIAAQLTASGFPYRVDEFETLNVGEYSCPDCGSSDRDRLCALHLSSLLRSARQEQRRLRVVEFAPSPALRAFLSRKSTLVDYRCADLFMEGVDDRVDITDMREYADAQFDVLVCSHVLEHVDDDRRALTELRRILRPGGQGLVLTPVIDDPSAFDEDPSESDERERWRRFGQGDHVRLYSRDVLVERLQGAGFEVARLGRDHFGPVAMLRRGITPTSVLYVVRRPLT